MFVSFLPAKNNKMKLASICQTVHQHFQKKDKLLIYVPNEEAAVFMDALLWKYPEESFTPHVKSEVPVEESVVITCSNENLNGAHVLLHLCPHIHPAIQKFVQVYDLFDETDEAKLKIAQDRKQRYIELGFGVELNV